MKHRQTDLMQVLHRPLEIAADSRPSGHDKFREIVGFEREVVV
jgi:hypothetical protein